MLARPFLRNPIHVAADDALMRPRFNVVLSMMQQEGRDAVVYSGREYMSLWQAGRRHKVPFWIRKIDVNIWVFRLQLPNEATNPLREIPRVEKIKVAEERQEKEKAQKASKAKERKILVESQKVLAKRLITAGSKREKSPESAAKGKTKEKEAVRAIAGKAKKK